VKIFNIRVKKLAHLFGIIWIFSVISSLGILFAALPSKAAMHSDLIGDTFIAIVIVGVLSFALAVISYFLHFVNKEQKQAKKNKKKKNNDFANVKHKILVSSVVGLSIIGILMLVALLAKSTGIISGSSMEQTPTPPIEATSTPEVKSPTPTSIPVYVDPDPIITCTSSNQNCVGESISVRRSACPSITCCQIGDKWSVYATIDSCRQAQAVQQPTQNTGNRVPVFIPHFGYTLNCPSQNVAAIQSINSTMESRRSQWAQNLMDCTNNFVNTDDCTVACGNALTNAEHTCTDLYGQATDDSFSNCIKQASSDLATCQDACPNSGTSCNSVNPDEKDLSNQIKNLCN
jgi:flagellar basal body-associated protein FliL